jgi:hypothetical protein
MKQRVSFLEVFLKGAGPSPALVAAFVLGLLVIGVLSNLVYSLLTDWTSTAPVAWLPVLAAGVLTALAYGLYQRDAANPKTVQAVVDESRLAPRYPGLIWLLGPGPFDHLLNALKHHSQEGQEQQCWLVMQRNAPAVEASFLQLSQHLLEAGAPVRLHRIYLDHLDAQDAYQAVRTVWEREALEEKLRPEQVIADITSGTKPLTAGMVLAAVTTGYPLEYVETDRDAEGKPIPGSARVVLADLSFYLTRKATP